MSKLDPINVTTMDPNQLYTARLEFRSQGTDGNVMPNIEYSHHFADDYEGEFPAAYLAMRDICLMLSASVEMVPNTEYDELPEDPDERALLAIAQAQKGNQETEQ